MLTKLSDVKTSVKEKLNCSTVHKELLKFYVMDMITLHIVQSFGLYSYKGLYNRSPQKKTFF